MAKCDWGTSNPLMIRYHDEEWGVPVHDDRKQFEYLCLEVMQCGLSWSLMIAKRAILRVCFENFDFEKIAAYGDKEVTRILETPGMIRSRRKILAIIQNARCFLKIREEFGSFSSYLWAYTDNKTIIYDHHPEGFIPATNALSEKISHDLRKRGFKYLGGVTVYAHLQAAGLILDHGSECPCYQDIIAHYPVVYKKRYHERGVKFFGAH